MSSPPSSKFSIDNLLTPTSTPNLAQHFAFMSALWNSKIADDSKLAKIDDEKEVHSPIESINEDQAEEQDAMPKLSASAESPSKGGKLQKSETTKGKIESKEKSESAGDNLSVGPVNSVFNFENAAQMMFNGGNSSDMEQGFSALMKNPFLPMNLFDGSTPASEYIFFRTLMFKLFKFSSVIQKKSRIFLSQTIYLFKCTVKFDPRSKKVEIRSISSRYSRNENFFLLELQGGILTRIRISCGYFSYKESKRYCIFETFI